MTIALFIGQRGEWAKSSFPNRPFMSQVFRGPDILIRIADGSHQMIPTYDVIANYADGRVENHINGVQLETARFVAQCMVGSFGEK